jgi:undecaprenyl-diphosphatase
LGLTRPAAVRYSFLLAIPAVTAAGLFQIPDVFAVGGPGLQPSVTQLVIATLLAFAVGYATIAWLLRYVQRHSIYLFVWYRLALGLVVLVLLATGMISAT